MWFKRASKLFIEASWGFSVESTAVSFLLATPFFKTRCALALKNKSKNAFELTLVFLSISRDLIDQVSFIYSVDDFRIFVGDLGNECNDEMLRKAFSKYASFAKAKIVRDRRTHKSKGYGFVSFLHPKDYQKAMREMNGMLCSCSSQC